MKGKLKFDVAGIKNWLLAHGEKVAFGIVAIVFLMLVYSTLQHETLDAKYEPTAMRTLAESVGSHVTNSTWDQKREEIKVVNYAERAKSEPLAVGSYAIALPLNRPVADPKAKRAQPKILPPEELRVAAGMDIFQVKAAAGQPKDAQAEGQLKAQPWAVVTALVPIEKQQAAHAEALADAINYNPSRDMPQYLPPVLERAVIDPAKPDALTWEVVQNTNIGEANARRSDIVPMKFVNPVLTAPLGELVGGSQWGEAVAHPKVPLSSEVGTDTPKAPAAGQPGGAQPASTPPDEVVPYYLLRVFDYSVQPGRKYRYRVTLNASNPNAGVAPQFLEEPAAAQASSITSEPVGPTAVVTIPDGHGVVAGPVDGGTLYTEPSAKILVTAIDMASGLQAATEEVVRRGSVANTGPRTVKVPHPLEKSARELTRSFQSNFMVLDIHGGKDVTRRKHDPPLTSPGEILLLDATGNMTVRSELDDIDQFDKMVVRETPPPPRAKAAEKDDKQPARIRKSK